MNVGQGCRLAPPAPFGDLVGARPPAVARVEPEVEGVGMIGVGLGGVELDGPRGVAFAREALRSARGGFEGRERRVVEAATLGMPHVMGAGAERTPRPGVDDVET